MTSYKSLGPDATIPVDRRLNRFRYAALYRRQIGDHSFAAGAEWVRDQNNGREASSDRGNYYFRADFGRDAITNFRLGIPSRYSVGIGEGYRGFRWWEQQYFAGDVWKVRSNFTTNFGLRYQPITGPSEVNHITEINFDCDCKSLAPQFGFAWQLPRAGVIRAAYGLQFGDIYYQTLQQVRWDPPGFLKVEVQAPQLLNPLANTYLGPGARHTHFEVALHARIQLQLGSFSGPPLEHPTQLHRQPHAQALYDVVHEPRRACTRHPADHGHHYRPAPRPALLRTPPGSERLERILRRSADRRQSSRVAWRHLGRFLLVQ